MIVVDVETTGLDPLKHSIVSIGALDFDAPKNRFYEECRIWDGALIEEKAMEVNGFTVQQIIDKRKQSLEDAIKKFISWTGICTSKTLAGNHIATFDIPFLKSSAERYNIEWLPHYGAIDLYSVCVADMLAKRITLPIEKGVIKLKTDDILQYVGLPAEPKPHNGLIGAKMEAEALSRLIYKKQLLEEFFNYAIPEH